MAAMPVPWSLGFPRPPESTTAGVPLLPHFCHRLRARQGGPETSLRGLQVETGTDWR